MSSTINLNESTLTADSNKNEITLGWTPQTIAFSGVDIKNVSMAVNAEGAVSVSGSGSVSVSLKSVSIPIPADWQSGLGTGKLTCDVSLSGTCTLSTSNHKVIAKLSDLSASIMGYKLSPSDFSVEVDTDNINDFPTLVKKEIETGSGNLFNLFWSAQAKTPKNSATETVKIVFDKLALESTNGVRAVKAYHRLIDETSTITGSCSIVWDSKGFSISLSADADVLGTKTSVSGSSNSTDDLKSIPNWIKDQITPHYQNYTPSWLQNVGKYLHSLEEHKNDFVKLFHDKGYLATYAIIAADYARQSGAALDAKLLKAGGYSTADIAIALKQGLNQSAPEFVEALKEGLGETDAIARDLFFVAGYDYKTIGDYLKNAGCDTGYIATLFKNNGKTAEEALEAGLGTDYASMGRALHTANYTFNEMIDGIKSCWNVSDQEAVNAAVQGGYPPSVVGPFLRNTCHYNQGKVACFYRLHGDNGVNALKAVNDAFGFSSQDDANGLYDGGYSGASIANAFRGAFNHDKGQPGAIHNIGETMKTLGFRQGNLDGLSGALRDALKGYLPKGKKGNKGSVLPKPDTHPKGLKKPGF